METNTKGNSKILRKNNWYVRRQSKVRVIRILVFRVSKTKIKFGIVTHAFKPSTRAEEATDLYKFKASL